jgi:DNA-binding NtrC family response regulator
MIGMGKIYIVDDDELINAMLSRVLKSSGYTVRTATSADAVAQKIKAWSPDIVLLDIRIGDLNGIDVLQELVELEVPAQVVMLTADDTAETAVKAMKLGAADYLTKPFNVEEVKIVLSNILEKGKLKQEVAYLRKVQSEVFDKEIVGVSPAVRELKAKIEKMAEASVSTVLVTGESGTGKELFARYAHRLIREQRSPRFSPFIKLNCAALPETLLESELFGYEKGSFTDAKSDKKGLFELAEGGSILLDEIGDLKQSLQGKLLRVLEERMVRPVGGAEEIPIDTTVIATTNVDLAEAVAKGAFRKDLFYRLNTFNLHVPPLRERKDDILLLTAYYLSHYAQRFKQKTVKRFSREAEDFIKSYSWPGNIRELRNVVERLVVLESEEDIEPRHLPNWLIGQTDSGGQSPDGKFILPEKGISLDELEKDLIQQALERSKNNKAQAAKLLHISYDSLRYQVKKLGME